ncbi:olfactomedin-like protein 3B isoform X2 [Nerophis ophidion]|nr:olfactomedin-like protein 3B isoform X2 [Nerophis ophidion]
MHLCQEQWRHHQVLVQDLRKQSNKTMELLRQQHQALSEDLAAAADLVERVEGHMDSVVSQTSPRACAKEADRVVEQGLWSQEESRGDLDQDWEEIPSRVSDCMEIISSIRSVKILKRVGAPKGVWLRDPRSSKVYVLNGTAGDTVYQFESVKAFTQSPGGADAGTGTGTRSIRLPSAWRGSGVAVYNGYLYYVQQGADVRVVKYDLLSGEPADTAILPVESRSFVYGLNPETLADVAVDDHGLWLLYASSESEVNINLAKMDPVTLDIEHIWETPCPRDKAEAAFVACGSVYVVYNTRLPSRSRVQCVFDVNDKVTGQEAPLFYFPRRYGAHASLKYNAEEKQVYSWDDGYQILYRMNVKKKLN